jgi:hypothetical protein
LNENSESDFIQPCNYFLEKKLFQAGLIYLNVNNHFVSMRYTLIYLLIFVVSISARASLSPQAFIQKDVDRLVALFSDGIAVNYPEYRHIEFGKIFPSGRDDAIVLFNVEGFQGGNDHAEYLAFFESFEQAQIAGVMSHPFRLVAVTQIGGRGWRSFDWKKVKLGSGCVSLDGLKCGPNDPECCPSVPIRVTFRVTEGFIAESK